MTRTMIGRRSLGAALLSGCVKAADAPPGPAALASAAPPLPPPPVALDEAVLAAGNAVFAAIAEAGGRRTVVIDPLVNGVTGEQTAGTRALASRLAELARQRYPGIVIAPFSAATLSGAPLVMVGTFTPVNAANQPAGLREAYRFCLVMADLKSGTTIAKSVVRATPRGIDAAPTPSFADSPAWTADATVKGYLDTCQATRVGGPIPPVYLNGIVTAAMLSEAMDAYDGGRYREALALYTAARATEAGAQLRSFNGLYLSHARLGQREQAAEAFGDVVEYGLRNRSLAVKLLFRPASTALTAEPLGPGTYDMWLHQIAGHAARANACLQVTGHTSASGSAALNERLSVLRAEYVRERLEQDQAALKGRLIATGVGARQALVGTGADDATDLLDRRVEFTVMPSC